MNILFKFYYALSSFRFYRFVVHERAAATIRYFLLLIALISLVLTVRMEFKLLDISAEVAQWMVTRLPAITIKDGRVSSPVPQPFLVKDDKVGVFILDTTGKYARLDSTYDRGFLLTRDKLIFKQPGVGRREATLNLSQVKELEVNPTAIQAWRKFFYWASVPVVFLVFYLQEGFGKIAIVLLFSLSTLSLARRNPSPAGPLTWAQAVALGIYALTPVVAYEIFLAATGMNEFTVSFLGSEVPPFLFVSLAIYVLFLWGGTRACREP